MIRVGGALKEETVAMITKLVMEALEKDNNKESDCNCLNCVCGDKDSFDEDGHFLIDRKSVV